MFGTVFWEQRADCMIKEVSTVNDDNTDSVFEVKNALFANMDEGTQPQRLLVSDC